MLAVRVFSSSPSLPHSDSIPSSEKLDDSKWLRGLQLVMLGEELWLIGLPKAAGDLFAED